MAANSPIVQYIVLKKEDHSTQISHHDRPEPVAIHRALIGLERKHKPLLREDGRNNTYFVNTQEKIAYVNQDYILERTTVKPEGADIYFEITEAPNQNRDLTIVKMDLLVDTVRHRLPLSDDEWQKTAKKVKEKVLPQSALNQSLKRAGETVDDYNFIDRLFFVIEKSGYRQETQINTTTIYPTTAWTTNIATAQGVRGIGGIMPEDMPITRIEGAVEERGRIVITETTDDKKPTHDSLLPYLVCSYNRETKQFLGATLHYPIKRKLNDDKKSDQGFKEYPISAEEMDLILYSPSPQIAMAELFEQKIPQHMLLTNPFTEVKNPKPDQFILSTNKMLPSVVGNVSATTHFVFDETMFMPSALDEQERQKPSKRLTLALNPQELATLQQSLTMDETELSAKEEKEEKEDLAPKSSRQHRNTASYALDVYMDLESGVVQKDNPPFYVIRKIIIHDRKTGLAKKLNLKGCTDVSSAMAETMLELIEEDKELGPDNKIQLQYHILKIAVVAMGLKEAEVKRDPKQEKKSSAQIDENTLKLAKTLSLFPKQLLDRSGLASFEAVLAFTSLIALSKQTAILNLARKGLQYLEEQRKRKVVELTDFKYDTPDLFHTQLEILAKYIKSRCTSKGYGKEEEALKASNALEAFILTINQPYVSDNVVNPQLLVALSNFKQSISRADVATEVTPIIDAAIKNLFEKHTCDLQQAEISLSAVDFSDQEACKTTFQQCVTLLEAVYKAKQKITKEINAAFAILKSIPSTLYLYSGEVNPQWIVKFEIILKHLETPDARMLVEIALGQLLQQHTVDVENMEHKIPQDLSTEKNLETAYVWFKQLVFLVFARDAIAEKNLMGIMTEIMTMAKKPRINRFINIRLIEKLAELAKATRNETISKSAQSFSEKLFFQYNADRTANVSMIDDANKKRNTALDNISGLWRAFEDKVNIGDFKSGVDFRIKEQKDVDKFNTIQLELTEFLHAPNIVELLFIQSDELTRTQFLNKIDALIKSILALSKPEKGILRKYPNQAFYDQMVQLCRKLNTLCEELASVKIEEYEYTDSKEPSSSSSSTPKDDLLVDSPKPPSPLSTQSDDLLGDLSELYTQTPQNEGAFALNTLLTPVPSFISPQVILPSSNFDSPPPLPARDPKPSDIPPPPPAPAPTFTSKAAENPTAGGDRQALLASIRDRKKEKEEDPTTSSNSGAAGEEEASNQTSLTPRARRLTTMQPTSNLIFGQLLSKIQSRREGVAGEDFTTTDEWLDDEQEEKKEGAKPASPSPTFFSPASSNSSTAASTDVVEDMKKEDEDRKSPSNG